MKDNDSQDSRRRILDAAAITFAQKGYDGARVDEIAHRAGVNKALIYYYFKGKEELLEVLFAETMQAAIGLMGIPEMTDFKFSDTEKMVGLLYRFLDLLEERQDTVRVMLMESLKRSPVNDLIFTLIRTIIEDMFAAAGNAEGMRIEDRDFAMVMEFFTGIMPLLSYVVYHETWMERFGVSEADLRERFVRAFIGTHFAFSAAAYQSSAVAGAVAETARHAFPAGALPPLHRKPEGGNEGQPR